MKNISPLSRYEQASDLRKLGKIFFLTGILPKFWISR